MNLDSIKLTLSELLAVPNPTAGILLNDGDGVQVRYSAHDLVQSKSVPFDRTFSLSRPGRGSFPSKVADLVLSAYSEVSNQWALMRSQGEGKDKKYFIEIWSEERLMKTVSIGADLHKGVCADQWFGSFQWSPDAKLLVYVAERNPEKTAAFFEQDAKLKESVTPGSKFEFKETWGEQYPETSSPSLFVVDVAVSKVSELKVPRHLTCGQARWAPLASDDAGSVSYGLVFVGWSALPRRLGIIYCYNRPSALYYVALPSSAISAAPVPSANSNPNATPTPAPASASAPVEETLAVVQLTGVGVRDGIARSPRFSPDGKSLVFLSPLDGMRTHNGPARLCLMSWPSPLLSSPSSTSRSYRVVVDVVAAPSPDDGVSFPGLFALSLPPRCFLHSDALLVASSAYSDLNVYVVRLSSGVVSLLRAHCSLLDVDAATQRALVVDSYANALPSVAVLHVDSDSLQLSHVHVVDASAASSALGVRLARSVAVERRRLPVPGTRFVQEYVLMRPSQVSTRVPVIVHPHGGPHGVYDTCYLLSRALLVLSGHALLLVNFRGSTGFGLDFLDALPGHCGDFDVADTQDALSDALAKDAAQLDASAVLYLGGSHGGFIGAHLVGRDARFKAAALINPVTDIAAMLASTDIPDWCLVEAGEEARSADALARMYSISPMFHVDKGIAFYQSLRVRGVKTRLLVYPGEPHQFEKTEHLADYLLNTVSWFHSALHPDAAAAAATK